MWRDIKCSESAPIVCLLRDRHFAECITTGVSQISNLCGATVGENFFLLPLLPPLPLLSLSLFLSLSFLFSLVSTFCTGQDMHCSQIFVCNSIYAAERKRIAFRNAFETRRKPEYKAHWRYRARYHDEWRERPLRTICDVNSDSLALGRFYILQY